MPGQGGVRVPLNRFFDPLGRWGYLIENCRIDTSALHVLYNFVLFPDAFSGRDQNGTGLSDMGVLMEHNIRDNMDHLAAHGQKDFQCWSMLEGKYEGETLVIASCGPSLTESLPTLYRLRNRYKLLCLNRSLRPFMDPEVKPDFYYFVERRGIPDWVSEVEPFTGKPGKPFDLSGITLIATPQADRDIVRRFDADKCYWGYTELGSLGHMPQLKRLKKYDVKAATTIGNAPFIAWKLGFKKIIFVGCDFSLDCSLEINEKEPDKSMVHPTRMYFDKDWQSTHYAKDQNWIKRAMPCIGIHNRCVMVDPGLSGHRTYMEAVLDILHHDAGVECINASPRGTMRFNCMDLEEALEDRSLVEDAVCRSD